MTCKVDISDTFLTLLYLYRRFRQVELPIIFFLQLNCSDTLDGIE